jgi:type III restriction enzyme
MPDVLIENPILNSPYEEPQYHYRFSDEGITNEIVEGRRRSTYVVPIPAPRGRARQLAFASMEEAPLDNPFVDQLRAKVKAWRQGGYPMATNTTHRLLEYWTNPEREGRLFF